MKIAIGCDHGAFRLKNEIIEFLNGENYEVKDFGTYSEESCDYPDIALPVAEAVANKEYDFGILVCGTGIGIGIDRIDTSDDTVILDGEEYRVFTNRVESYYISLACR